jgi:hypothetical protein
MTTGSIGEMSPAPNAGDALIAATGAGAVVDEAELGDAPVESPGVASPPETSAPAGLTPAGPLVTAANPPDVPEQAVLATRMPTAMKARAAARADLERRNCMWSSTVRQRAPGPIGKGFVVMEFRRIGKPDVGPEVHNSVIGAG